MKTEIDVKRFLIKVIGDDDYEADAYITLRSDISGEQMGLTWIACYENGNQQGTVCNLPYVVIDNESPLTLEKFQSIPFEQIGQPTKHDNSDVI
jgi:hypothetical protein